MPEDSPATSTPPLYSLANIVEQPIKDRYAHRRDFPNRATSQCAADHPHFQKKHALAYHFLVILSSEEDEGKRTITKLRCSLCPATASGVWTLSPDWDGSTGNFAKHFERNHKVWWKSVTDADAERIPSMRKVVPGAGDEQQGTLAGAFANVSSQAEATAHVSAQIY